MSCSFAIPFCPSRDLIGRNYLDAQLLAVSRGYFQEPVIGGHEPSCRGSFGKCKMQCVERAESESSKRASTIGGGRARFDRDSGGFKPQPRGEPPVFARIPLVLEIVRG